jgi:hypothetical protein
MAYLKNIKKRDDGIEYHIGPEPGAVIIDSSFPTPTTRFFFNPLQLHQLKPKLPQIWPN